MSDRTNEINKITGTIISVSVKLIIYALVVLMLFQCVTKGYRFGYEVFHSSAVSAAPGIEKIISVNSESTSVVGKQLKDKGLIANEYIFQIQAKFYDYEIKKGTYTLNSSMTTKDILKTLDEGLPDKEQETKP